MMGLWLVVAKEKRRFDDEMRVFDAEMKKKMLGLHTET